MLNFYIHSIHTRLLCVSERIVEIQERNHTVLYTQVKLLSYFYE
jgi:hypothetical protein